MSQPVSTSQPIANRQTAWERHWSAINKQQRRAVCTTLPAKVSKVMTNHLNGTPLVTGGQQMWRRREEYEAKEKPQ